MVNPEKRSQEAEQTETPAETSDVSEPPVIGKETTDVSTEATEMEDSSNDVTLPLDLNGSMETVQPYPNNHILFRSKAYKQNPQSTNGRNETT